MEINNDLLIALVRERPLIWDKTCKYYKNRQYTDDAWNDICVEMDPQFQDYDGVKQINVGKSIIKRWTNLRDNWIKYNKKLEEFQSGGGREVRQYVYYDTMLFLKTMDGDMTDMTDMTNMAELKFEVVECVDVPIANETEEYTESEPKRNKRKKTNKRNKYLTRFARNKSLEGSVYDKKCKTSSAVQPSVSVVSGDLLTMDKKLMKMSDSVEGGETSRSLHFFRGIAPTVDKFDDDTFIEFQFQVISIIKNLKQGEQTEYM